jgi:hypothetical protein
VGAETNKATESNIGQNDSMNICSYPDMELIPIRLGKMPCQQVIFQQVEGEPAAVDGKPARSRPLWFARDEGASGAVDAVCSNDCICYDTLVTDVDPGTVVLLEEPRDSAPEMDFDAERGSIVEHQLLYLSSLAVYDRKAIKFARQRSHKIWFPSESKKVMSGIFEDIATDIWSRSPHLDMILVA